MKKVVVYDLETLLGCFTYSDYNIKTKEINQFVLHKDRFELNQLIDYLASLKGQIGFNNNGFDYPILHYILKNYKKWKNKSNEDVILLIYNESQRIINLQKDDNKYGASIKLKDVKIHQLDLFRVWHYNNKARSCSLKNLEISMNYPNVMDMPIHHSTKDISISQIDEILEYNLNDVMATYEFYLKSIEKINLRKSLIKQFDIPCINYSDSKIGEQLILKLYCDKTNSNDNDIKQLRSKREEINLGELIFPYINFKSVEFNKILNIFKNKTIKETKGSINESVIYKGFKYEFGSGGIHGCIKPGMYQSDDDYIIIDADVASLYPNIAIVNKLFPEHLGSEFISVYQDIINLRLKAKKEGNLTLSDGFKLAANSVYGKSNDENSFLYDPKFTMAITVNGQLLLSMLAETLVNWVNDVTVLQINTDGITVRIPRNQLEDYYGFCNDWENETKLKLEYVEYSKMWIGDVNNYGALTFKNKIKNKGRFEVDKVVGNEPAYHKDNSFKIIPIALQEYFVNNVPIEETINSHKNIYDFCGKQRFKSDDCAKIHYLKGNSEIIEKQQKNVRYYISNKGATFIKYYAKGSTEMINKGYLVTIFNKYERKDNYNVDFSFYIKECKKEIHIIQNKQLELF